MFTDYSNQNNGSRSTLRNLNSIPRVCEDVNSIHRADMKNALTLSIALAAALSLSFIPNVYAGGPRLDYDEKYEALGQENMDWVVNCWADGYDDGFEWTMTMERADGCENSIGNPYLEAWTYGCIDTNETREYCEDLFADPY